MARINLLPWRQAERERKNREFLTIMAGVLLLSLLAAFAAWSYFNDTLDSQKKANEKIKAENKKLDAALVQIDSLEKQRNDMLAQMKVIQDLQGRRPIPVRVWDDIARMIPAQLYLTNMKRVGDTITFTGRADNPNVVSDFIRNLDSSQWLENSAVRSITQPQAVAYQQPAQATATPGSPAGHPEDNYVVFSVTTKITKNLGPDSATGATSTSALTSQPTPIVTVVNSATTSTSNVANTISNNAKNPTSHSLSAPNATNVANTVTSGISPNMKTGTTKNVASNDSVKPASGSATTTSKVVTQLSATTTNKEKS